MPYWCIKYKCKTEEGETIKHFFCFAETKGKAAVRFCRTSDNNKSCIISIHKVEG